MRSSIARRRSYSAPASCRQLEHDKATTEKKLADWVHCVSATTPEGKAKIRDLTAQLQSIDSKIDQAKDKGAQAESAAALADSPASRPTDSLGNAVDVFV